MKNLGYDEVQVIKKLNENLDVFKKGFLVENTDLYLDKILWDGSTKCIFLVFYGKFNGTNEPIMIKVHENNFTEKISEMLEDKNIKKKIKMDILTKGD